MVQFYEKIGEACNLDPSTFEITWYVPGFEEWFDLDNLEITKRVKIKLERSRAKAPSGSGDALASPRSVATTALITHPDYAYDNQKKAAREINTHFREGYRCVACRGDVQGGKTGTYLCASYYLVSAELGVENILIICGASDNRLKKQCEDRLKEFRKHYVSTLRRDNEQMRLNRAEDSGMKVMFSTDMRKETIKDNTIVVLDESHYAGSDDNLPHKLLKDSGLKGLLADDPVAQENAKRKNIFVLSVSATPFAQQYAAQERVQSEGEEIDDLEEEKEEINDLEEEKEENDDSSSSCDKTPEVVLETAPNYIGPQNYMDAGHILPCPDVLTPPGEDEFKEILRDPNLERKYVLIRAQDAKKRQVVEQACTELGHELRYDDMGNGEVPLDRKPHKTTVVLYKHRLRMGSTIHKQHVGAAFELSKNQKSDSCIQSFLARLCGTPSDADPFTCSAKIYISSENILQVNHYLEFGMATNATNVSKGKITKEQRDSKHAFGPFKADYSEVFGSEDVGFMGGARDKGAETALKYLNARDCQVIRDMESRDGGQAQEVVRRLKLKQVSLRDMETGTFRGGYAQKIREAAKKGRTLHGHYLHMRNSSNDRTLLVIVSNQEREVYFLTSTEAAPSEGAGAHPCKRKSGTVAEKSAFKR